MSSLRDDLDSAFADWPRIPGNPVDEDISEAINAEYCHASFAGRTWQSLDEDDLYGILWSCHHYFTPEAIVALFPTLIRASLDNVDWMFEFLTLVQTSIESGRLSSLKSSLNRDQIDGLTRFSEYAERTLPFMKRPVSELLNLISPERQ